MTGQPLQDTPLCKLCGTLRASEYAYQKYGWPENDSALPAVSGQLMLIKDLDPYGGREKKVLQCPACGVYYFYRTDYEYLVNGSEDEQFLTRLTAEEAAALLAGDQDLLREIINRG